MMVVVVMMTMMMMVVVVYLPRAHGAFRFYNVQHTKMQRFIRYSNGKERLRQPQRWSR